MNQRTPLYDSHLKSGAKMVDFAGWDMPINYGSQIDEHHAVRTEAGMFDVSHMTVVDLEGEQTRPFLKRLVANNVGKLKDAGKALYTCMLNEQGGVIDDLIIYFFEESHFRLVVNSSTREKDVAWINKQAKGFSVRVTERPELAMVAVQGPNARQHVIELIDSEHRAAVDGLTPFKATFVDDWFIARTGYTGEDGFEIVLPAEAAPAFWQALEQRGVRPCGLGARDTLRLEAGMALYGTDMDDTLSPLQSGLAWTVGWDPQDRLFIGRQALETQKSAGVDVKFVGLILEDKGVLRNHQKISVEGIGEGEVTSGSFSPTLKAAIALARVPKETGETCHVDIRGRLLKARVVKPPFVRNGKALVSV
ncbi:MAG: glycine cleavage system aminomethyltransferase GcvT [Gammaproteobacteria bacterium]